MPSREFFAVTLEVSRRIDARMVKLIRVNNYRVFSSW
jgi:hypothetical protein